jgi:hypothetical protein
MTGVVTAVSHRWDAAVAAALEPLAEVRIVRRCADLAELAAVAAAGLGQCAVVSADLRGLDLTVIDDLHRHGLWVVGIHPPGEEGDERRLRQLAVDVVVPVDASPEVLASAVIERRAAPAPPVWRASGRTGSVRPSPTTTTGTAAGTRRLLGPMRPGSRQDGTQPSTSRRPGPSRAGPMG